MPMNPATGSRTPPPPCRGGYRAKPSATVVQASPMLQTTVRRVRLRSMICVPPNCDEPTPKAPESPASLPECMSTSATTENARSMWTMITTARSIGGSLYQDVPGTPLLQLADHRCCRNVPRDQAVEQDLQAFRGDGDEQAARGLGVAAQQPVELAEARVEGRVRLGVAE